MLKNDALNRDKKVNEIDEKIGICLFRQNQFDQAIETLTQVASFRETNEKEVSQELLLDYQILSESLYKLNRFEESINYNLIVLQEQITAYGELDQRNCQVMQNLALCYQKLGNIPKSKEYNTKIQLITQRQPTRIEATNITQPKFQDESSPNQRLEGDALNLGRSNPEVMRKLLEPAAN